jgi:hypothetical protein
LQLPRQVRHVFQRDRELDIQRDPLVLHILIRP